MITIKDIIKWSKPHPTLKYVGGNRRQSRFGNDQIEFSIVGGGGLYGDFEKTFEVAIFDRKTNNFVTRFFYPEATDDVIPYMGIKEVEKLVNSIIRDKLSVEK